MPGGRRWSAGTPAPRPGREVTRASRRRVVAGWQDARRSRNRQVGDGQRHRVPQADSPLPLGPPAPGWSLMNRPPCCWLGGGLIIPSSVDRGTSPADQAEPVKIVSPAGRCILTGSA